MTGISSRQQAWLRIALLATVVVPVLMLLGSSGAGDVNLWLDWMAKARELGPIGAYQQTAIDYPPGSQFLLWVVTVSLPGLSAIVQLKTLLLAAMTISAVTYALWFRTINAASVTVAAFAIGCIGLGYLDVLWAPALAGALWALQRGHLVAFGALYALGCSIKWQPILLAPLMLIYLVGSQDPKLCDMDRWRRLALSVLPAVVVATVALVIFGPLTVGKSLGGTAMHGLLSANALNLPWLLGAIGQDAGSPIQYVDFTATASWVPLICRVLAFTAYLGALAAWWRSRRTFTDLIVAASLCSLAYFAFSVGVHENHLLMSATLALAGIYCVPSLREAFIAILVMAQVNLVMFYGFTGTVFLDRMALGIDLSVIVAVIFLAVLCVLAFVMVRFMVTDRAEFDVR